MGKKFSILKWTIYLVALGIFIKFEYDLINKYLQEEKIRQEVIYNNTKKIEESFRLRNEGFYLDSKYIKMYQEEKIKREKEEEIDEL